MKPIIYRVLYLFINEEGKSEWKEKQIKKIYLSDLGIEKVETEDGEEIVIDNISAYLREFVGMFDKTGTPLLSEDIVKFPFDLPTEENQEPIEVKGIISFINGAYCIPLPEKEAIVYLTQQNVLMMEKIGDIYRNSDQVEKPIDEKIFENQGSNEVSEVNNQTQE